MVRRYGADGLAVGIFAVHTTAGDCVRFESLAGFAGLPGTVKNAGWQPALRGGALSLVRALLLRLYTVEFFEELLFPFGVVCR
jgi:hypothetical protein